MKNIFSLLLSMLLCLGVSAQTETNMFVGMVTDKAGTPLFGATVQWEGTQIGSIAAEDGIFSLPHITEPSVLWVKYVGYEPTKIDVLPDENNIWIEVDGVNALSEVEIRAKVFGSSVSTLDPRNIESISADELKKAPCCNLSESFDTNGSVDVAYANAITGVREIQMLGLRGIYSQFMMENRPTLYGIATPYAFEFIPGTWVSGIQIAKGASTVKNGYQGFTGQINTELEKPHNAERPLFVNAYANRGGRGELNVHLNKEGKGKIHTGLLLHGSLQDSPMDFNDDNFYDMLSRHQLNALSRTFYESPNWCAQINVQALTDRRTGGQISPLANGYQFPFAVDNDRFEVWAKAGKKQVGTLPNTSLGNILSTSWHRTSGLIGNNSYQATQRSFYWQSLYHTIIKTTDHQIEFAPSLTIDDYQEQINEADISRQEIIPGGMVEYSYNHSSLRLDGAPDLNITLGMRADYHSIFGWMYTPRVSSKYNFTENSVMRVSAGRGYRSPSVIAENLSVLATNRAIDFTQVTAPEEAWNFGVNYTHRFELDEKEGSISFDGYRTDFVRQLLVDQETDISTIQMYYTEEKAYSNSLMATLQYNVIDPLEIKLVYKFNDVRSTFADGELKKMPFVATHRGLVTIDYKPNDKWMFNTSAHILGPQRLPSQAAVPTEFSTGFPDYSPAFATFNAQVTRKIGRFEVYLGGENLGGYTQDQLIMNPENPQSEWFNGSLVYAPAFAPNIYIGVRYEVAETHDD